uniref:Secreted protein n=1 Tax=Mesocestoides corti TaxID=53468 RepID=A0A5K3ENN9_MESCO
MSSVFEGDDADRWITWVLITLPLAGQSTPLPGELEGSGTTRYRRLTATGHPVVVETRHSSFGYVQVASGVTSAKHATDTDTTTTRLNSAQLLTSREVVAPTQ